MKLSKTHGPPRIGWVKVSERVPVVNLFDLVCSPFSDTNFTANSVARVQDHAIAFNQAGEHFRAAVVAMPDLDLCRLRSSILHRVDGPFFALPKKCRHRDVQHVRFTPNGHVYYDPIIMAEPRPLLRWPHEIDGGADALLLYPQSRDFEKACWVNPHDSPGNRRTAPAIDPHRSTNLDLDCISRQKIRHHFEVQRITDFDQGLARKYNDLTLLNNLQHDSGHGCEKLNAAVGLRFGGCGRWRRQSGCHTCAFAAPHVLLRFCARQSRFVGGNIEPRLFEAALRN